MQQEHARQDLLPGAAGPALLVRLGRGDTLRAQLRGRQHPARGVREATEGAGGERGVVGHDPEVPAPAPPVNRCYTLVDKSGQDYAKVRAFDYRYPLVRTAIKKGYGSDYPNSVTPNPAAPHR